MDIEKPLASLKLEPVSSRLKAKLIHPNKNGIRSDVVWSPDGSRIVAGDYPGGTVQVWDAKTGQQLVRIETKKPGFRSDVSRLSITPDFRYLAVGFEKREIERFEKDNKYGFRARPDGGIQLWDLQTGQLTTTLRQSPNVAVTNVTMAANGNYILALELSPGEFSTKWPVTASLWRLSDRHRWSIPIEGMGCFDPKCERIASATMTDQTTNAIHIHAIPTFDERCVIPIKTPHTRAHPVMFSADGSLLIGFQQTLADKNKFDDFSYSLTFWSCKSGEEVAKLCTPEKNMIFYAPALSPSGRVLAVGTLRGQQNFLYMIDVQTQKITHRVPFVDTTVVLSPSFSPDGRWIVVATRQIPKDDAMNRVDDPEQFPQARIHLINAATGIVKETLIAPPAFVNKVVFSPDGNTLACDGHGKVLLWDVADLVAREPK